MPQDQICLIEDILIKYKARLDCGAAQDKTSEMVYKSDQQLTRCYCTKICQLSVNYLQVSGTLIVNGVNFNTLSGIAGAVGAIGATGATGIPGVGGILGWGYIYNLTAETVAIGDDVPFDSNGTLSGVTHATPSPSIGIVNAGTYYIAFSVSGSEPNQFAIFVNGVASTSTVYSSGAGTQQNNGLAILTLGAGDVVTLVNHSSAAAVTLASVIGGTQANVNASVILLRIA